MKDEHDQRRIDYEKQLAAYRAKQDPVYVAQQRARQNMESWLPVSMVANQFGVTSRRIRALLAEGRLKGRQLENGYWEVAFPFFFAMGRRGPKLLMQRPKKPELKLV